MINALLKTLYSALNIFSFFVVTYIILNWLVYFDIVNHHNRLVRSIYEFLGRLIEPILDQIRRIIPTFGAIDLSPIVLFLAISFIQQLIVEILMVR